jgi:ABC-type multidrug transport system fused ATPase/permease subunit
MRLESKFHLGIISTKVQKYLRVESINRLIQGDLIWHEKENVGNKMQRINEGVSSIQKFMHFYNNQGLNLITSLVGIITVFAFFNIKYAFMAILFMFTYLFVEFKFNKKIAKKTLVLNKLREKASGKAYEVSSNISTIKSLGIEKLSSKNINRNEKNVLEARINKSKLNNLKWISIQIVASVFFALFIFIVGKDILTGILTAGVIIIYISYVNQLRSVLNTISSELDHLIDIKYGICRAMQIYNLMPDIDERGATNINNWDKIKINDLGFQYKKEPVLNDFNLEITKGEKLGVVGKSGSGKSTFFKLFLKLYLPKKGMIYYDNKPITNIKRDSLLEQISIVPQETEVFNLSLKENITISKKGKFDKKLYKKAIEASQLSEVISKLKNKDLSLIGEKGIRLSGGEKQRLGIARAIYKDSNIIIFDESTSNLDYITEKKIQDALDKLNKTIIISAHRLSTLERMDKIIVFDKGKIVEEGCYEELLHKKGKFYEIWEGQKINKNLR